MARTSHAYGWVAKALHWLMALLIIAGFALGLSMVELSMSPTKLRWYSWHKWMGITVLGLVACRMVWRLLNPAAPLPASIPNWQRKLASITHVLLYLLMLLTPLVGWLFSSAKGIPTVYLGLWQLPNLVAKDEMLAEVFKSRHALLAYTLAALVALHVAAALKHHFIDRDDVLTRMLPWARRKRTAS